VWDVNPKVSKALLTSILILALILPNTSIATTSQVEVNLVTSNRQAYVSPILLSEEYWRHGAYVDDESLLSFTKPDPLEFNVESSVEFGQVLILLDPSITTSALRGKVLGIVASLPTHLYNIVVAWITREQLPRIATTRGVLAILPDVRLDALINREMKVSSELLSREEVSYGELQAGGSGYHYTTEITGAYSVWTTYKIKGENATLAIIDTGVDYGSPGLGVGVIARDKNGVPLIFDASSLGLVLTPVRAIDIGGGYIFVNASDLYVFYPPYYVYRWTNRLYARITGCASRSLWLTFPSNWYIGGITHYGDVKFGLALQVLSLPIGTLIYTIPVIVVDSNGDGLYDTLYADTTTALYLVRSITSYCGVNIPGDIGTSPDFSFADEVPVKYGSEVIARDLDGDGIRDYSIGTLAGYVYDSAFAIILEKLGEWKSLMPSTPPLSGYSTADVIMWETWNYEPVAAVWPGLDPYGDYVVIEYDYNSHGTFCANTAAGRDFYAETGYGNLSIAGQAPGAKIAASPALYFGSTMVSIYFFSGFDMVTEYGDGSRYLWPDLLVNPWIMFEGYEWRWVYTGEHQVDITSNSYGISGWALWGWNTGADPESAVFDYTILVSGTMHFVAAGNGGPGYGTVSSPASSSFAIAVGAATEFTYRPIYGYYWPGSSRDVITWSNRGPTELGVAKPDLVAVGSFAWAVGRTWDALGNIYGVRNLTGKLAYNLFSGTSQATPMTAGVGALVVSAYRSKYGSRIPAYLLKTVLMNNAKDMGYDELSQGAGFVNAYDAVRAVLDPSLPRVYSADFARDVLSELGVNYNTVTYGAFTGYTGSWYEPKVFIPLVTYYAARTITIEGAGNYRVYAARLESVGVTPACSAIAGSMGVVDCTGDTVLINVTASTTYSYLFFNVSTLAKYDFFEIEGIYPFEYFETGGRYGNYSLMISTSVMDFAYWIDYGADGVFSWYETARITYDIRRANAVRIQSGKLSEKLREIEDLAERYMGVDVSTLPKYLVLRLGVSGSTYRGLLPIKVRIVGYKLVPWSQVRVSPTMLNIMPGGRGLVAVSVFGPLKPGFYSGYVVVEEASKGFRALVPVSFFSPLMVSYEQVYRITPSTENTPRKNTYLRGAFDYTWRYESGDWRVFKVVITDYLRFTWALGVRVTWPTYGSDNYASNLDVHVYGQYSYVMVDENNKTYTYSVSGVQLGAELTRDPAGGSSYNPTRFWDSLIPGESLIVAPASRPGVYRVVVRNIQFRGLEYCEPFTIELFPITLRASPIYMTSSKTITYLVSIKTPYLPSYTLPYNVYAYNEGIYTTTSTYISNLTQVGITVTPVIQYWTTNSILANITIKYSASTPRGVYVIPITAAFPVPVTTVGWNDGGQRNYYFYYNEIPITLTIRIYY
jgi:subtilisin family serine protease